MAKRLTAVVAALLTMILATGVVLAAHQFPDVPDNHTFHNDIGWFFDNGMTVGYSNGNFGPEDYVTRGQMAAFFHRYNSTFPSGTVPRAPSVPPVPPVRLAR